MSDSIKNKVYFLNSGPINTKQETERRGAEWAEPGDRTMRREKSAAGDKEEEEELNSIFLLKMIR